MPAEILPSTTAGIAPEQFSDDLFFAGNGKAAAIILALFLLIGFALRISQLGAESLGEDELNKLQTVQDYRTNGLSGRNGEHPFLMKGLQMVSIVASEKLNGLVSSPDLKISEEAALRFPLALFGTFTILLLFLLGSELFGRSIGLVSAALWAVEPMAIGFDRIAKEDGLVIFFFLLTCLFWVRSQSSAERGEPHWTRYTWAAAVGFGALMASKYYLYLLAVIGAYYNIFRHVPGKNWNLGKIRWLKFFAIMGVTFLILNPTILFTDTWREIFKFSSENRIGHDSYEFMGSLYRNQMTAWFSGVPWTFYYVFIAVKTSLGTLVLLLIGIPIMFKRRLGDGRFLVFFWAFMWLMPFTVLGGKFTRYFTLVEPVLVITAAAGFCFSLKWLTNRLFGRSPVAAVCQTVLLAVIITLPLVNSLAVTPHFRLFTNPIGGGTAAAGTYFPHDEFYDAATRDIVARIAEHARTGAVVACETPTLFEYYAHQTGRDDLVFIALSDRSQITALKAGDYIVIARGRRYFSNAAYQDFLAASAKPAAEIKIMDTTAAKLYQLDDTTLAEIKALAK